MSSETKMIEIESVFERVKNLNDSDKMLLKRAWKIPFNMLRMPQKALFFSLIGSDDDMAVYKMDFLLDMMAAYVKQGCENGKSFEQVLKSMYDTGNAAARQKIGYMIDEQDKRIFVNYVTRYVEMCAKDTKINIIKLTDDILNWPYKSKNEWIKTIAGITDNNEKMEEK